MWYYASDGNEAKTHAWRVCPCGIFAFDLLPYAEHLDHRKEGKELPWPLPKRHFRSRSAARTYEEHLEAWALMDAIGFDGVGFNEHHTSLYGLMTSPNMMAAATAAPVTRVASNCSSMATCCPYSVRRALPLHPRYDAR